MISSRSQLFRLIRNIFVLAGILVLIRDLFFRLFFIYPQTDPSGKYAATIESKDIYRWVAPVVSGRKGPYDLFFIGNSHVMDAVDPQIVSRITGLKAYNFALYQLPSANLIELLIRYGCYPKIVVLDFATRYCNYRLRPEVNDLLEAQFKQSEWYRQFHDLRDRAAWLAPSLFVPRPYFCLTTRAWQKVIKLRQTRLMETSRYSPFQPWTSYRWHMIKSTNHRVAEVKRSPSSHQIMYEQHLLEKMKQEAFEICDFTHPDFLDGMARFENLIATLCQHKVTVVFMRLPMHSEIIFHENKHFYHYFKLLKDIGRRYNISFVDLNESPHREAIGALQFYADGMHILSPGDKQISQYLAHIIQEKLGAKLVASRKQIAS